MLKKTILVQLLSIESTHTNGEHCSSKLFKTECPCNSYTGKAEAGGSEPHWVKLGGGAREMAPWLRVPSALPEPESSVPRTEVRWYMPACNMAFSHLLGYPHTWHTFTDIHTNIKNKSEKKKQKKRRKKYQWL